MPDWCRTLFTEYMRARHADLKRPGEWHPPPKTRDLGAAHAAWQEARVAHQHGFASIAELRTAAAQGQAAEAAAAAAAAGSQQQQLQEEEEEVNFGRPSGSARGDVAGRFTEVNAETAARAAGALDQQQQQQQQQQHQQLPLLSKGQQLLSRIDEEGSDESNAAYDFGPGRLLAEAAASAGLQEQAKQQLAAAGSRRYGAVGSSHSISRLTPSAASLGGGAATAQLPGNPFIFTLNVLLTRSTSNGTVLKDLATMASLFGLPDGIVSMWQPCNSGFTLPSHLVNA